MKQFFTLAFLAASVAMFAQVGVGTWELDMANESVSPEGVYLTSGVGSSVIWSHDCNVGNCSDWTFGNGSEEVGSPWEDIDLNFECT
ncbi:MAG: hypothetical protein ACKVJH_09225, partial [Flavobacteriales bacterium]